MKVKLLRKIRKRCLILQHEGMWLVMDKRQQKRVKRNGFQAFQTLAEAIVVAGEVVLGSLWFRDLQQKNVRKYNELKERRYFMLLREKYSK